MTREESEARMLRWLWRRLSHRPVVWQRSIVEVRDLETLARTGLAGMLLAQEKARLDFVSAREACECNQGPGAMDRVQESLVHLQTTNAVVQALLNEHQIEQLLATRPPDSEITVGKSR